MFVICRGERREVLAFGLCAKRKKREEKQSRDVATKDIFLWDEGTPSIRSPANSPNSRKPSEFLLCSLAVRRIKEEDKEEFRLFCFVLFCLFMFVLVCDVVLAWLSICTNS
jgi:hypothetical protein